MRGKGISEWKPPLFLYPHEDRFPHKPRPIGGTGSFQERFTFQLQNLGWQVVYPEDRVDPDIVLVVAGTRKLRWLRRCRRQGIRIVHRLGGMNWLYRTGGARSRVPIAEMQT